ncbi:MAG: stage II sporulation protein R [Lachnospiraceae bacterium]
MEKRKRGILLLLMVLGFMILGKQQFDYSLQSSIARKVIRFHVLANSDSDMDQEIKLKVRDDVGVYMEQLLSESESIEQTRQIIRENLTGITEVANQSLREQEVDYRAVASLAYSEFPEKEYEGLTFPEGEYEALTITLGKGEGHNWWCVMYPNLCFSNSIYRYNDKEWKCFQKTLTPREYRKILESGNYTIRFKFLEYLKKKR